MSKDKLAQVFHFDLYGKREEKYDFLSENSISSIEWNELPNVAPNYFMVQKDFEAQEKYDKGFSVNGLFLNQSMGITSGDDSEYVDFYKNNLSDKFEKSNVQKIDYRVFDTRHINYNPSLLARARYNFMRNLFSDNYAISFVRRSRNDTFLSPFITKNIVDKGIVSTLDNANIFPLYLYSETNPSTSSGQAIQQTIDQSSERKPNLNKEIVEQIAKRLQLSFITEKTFSIPSKEQSDPDFPPLEGPGEAFAPIDILDYIYAVLHSSSYREKYNEFLKIDFPRVPYPKDAATFWQLVKLGGQIRQIHLLESPVVEQYITQYPIDGDNKVGKIYFKKTADAHGKVYVNYDKTPPSGAGGLQYFDNVPETAWEFYIGGYQPAQKWLKDRKKRKLEFDDILHYQKIIVALSETDRLMKEIDKIDFMETDKREVLENADGANA